MYLFLWYIQPTLPVQINTASHTAHNSVFCVTYVSVVCFLPWCYTQKWTLKTLSAHCWLFLSGRMYQLLCTVLGVGNENKPNVDKLSPSPVISLHNKEKIKSFVKINIQYMYIDKQIQFIYCNKNANSSLYTFIYLYHLHFASG